MKKKLLCGLFAFNIVTSFSQKSGPDSLALLDPVVVTGVDYASQLNKSSLNVSVINVDEMRNSGMTSLQEVMSHLSSSTTIQTNGMGTFVNFNGVSDDYMIVMVDGKKVTGDDRWSRISLDNVERIEVLTGAASVLYGTDAMAGVVNVITKNSGAGVEANSYTKVMSKGRLSQDLGLAFNHKRFSSSTSFNHRQADNWQVNHYQAFDENGQQVLKLTGRPMSMGYRSENVNQVFGWKFSDKFKVNIRGNYYDYLTARPRTATYFTQKSKKDADGNMTYDYTSKQAYTYDIHHVSYDYGADAEWKLSDKATLIFDVHSDNFTSWYNYWQTEKDEAKEETRKETRLVEENVKGVFDLGKKNRMSFGVNLLQDKLDSETDNIDGKKSNTENVYVQDELMLCEYFNALAGVRYTHNDNFGSNLTPNVAVSAHYEKFHFKAGYAGGYKTPTLSQLYATDQAKTSSRYTIYNTELKPERNNFWNVNLSFQGKHVQAGVGAFLNDIYDMINYRTMTQEEIDSDDHLLALYNEGWTTIRQRDNIDEARIKGLNFNLKLLLPAGFIVSGNYTLTDSEAKTQKLDSKTQKYMVEKNPVDKSVKNAGQVTISWDKRVKNNMLNLSLNGFAQDRRYSSTYGYAAGYGQWDFAAKYAINRNSFVLEPSVGIENLFDKRDKSPWNSNFSTINPGRSAFVGLALKFKE